jgi:hypothetical protein
VATDSSPDAGEILVAVALHALRVLAQLRQQRLAPLLDGGVQCLGLVLGECHGPLGRKERA